MIEYLNGEITELDPTHVIVECAGIGYYCAISVYTYDHLKQGTKQKVWVSESIREDAHLLYGFSSKQERELFEMLISVSGVGPSIARCILSSLAPDELVAIVSSGNDKMLKNVKGIGAKTAQRIIVDLRDRISDLGIAAATPSGSPIMATSQNAEEAVQALQALGYPAAAAQKAVSALLQSDPNASVQNLIKQALHMM